MIKKTLEERVAELEVIVSNAVDATKEPSSLGAGVNAGLRGDGITPYEETAILRKTLMKVIQKTGLSMEDFPEFVTYFNKVEALKAEIKESSEEHI